VLPGRMVRGARARRAVDADADGARGDLHDSPSSPAYPCTYVRVYASTPETITYGYTAGYAMSYVSAGVIVYGTGYYYPPYIYPAPIPFTTRTPTRTPARLIYNSTTVRGAGRRDLRPVRRCGEGRLCVQPNTVRMHKAVRSTDLTAAPGRSPRTTASDPHALPCA